MCGISGFWGSPKADAQEILKSLNDAQWHRGPDAEGVWISSDQRVGFAHRRLSIVDLSPAGNQPMHSESGRYVITFNGEIYNFLRLRRELTALGHGFRSTSDTEVMLAAFEHWGVEDALRRFNGMFAAALWDKSEQRGYLFRDRLGVKPLYYQWHEGVLFFSSELSWPFGRIAPRSISRDALALFLRHGYIPAPYSIYEGVYKLLPGVVAIFSLEDAANAGFGSVSKFWDTQERINRILSNRDEEMSDEEALEQLDEVLRRSVQERMIADVPLGAFLSGGIDSSLVVSYMQQVSNSQVRTFTIGFDDPQFNEARFAKRVANHLGTQHTELTVTEQDALKVVPALPEIYGEPFADSSQIPTYLVSKLTRGYVTVALSGDGGDELFAGYNKYRSILKYRRILRRTPGAMLAVASSFMAWPRVPQIVNALSGDQQVARMLGGVRVFSTEREIRFRPDGWGPSTLPERLVKGASAGASIQLFPACEGNAIEQAMCHDLLGYLPDDILVKVDRASMAVSLEVRAPFADDFELFNVAWKLPLALKLNRMGGKVIVRKLLARFVPPELTERPKKGFAIPLTKWIRGALREWVSDCVTPSRLEQEGYLRTQEVALVCQKAVRGDEFYAHKLWAICQFQAWLASRSNIPSLDEDAMKANNIRQCGVC
jgi:asparagine synthase (glutamine-hydrolysing)